MSDYDVGAAVERQRRGLLDQRNVRDQEGASGANDTTQRVSMTTELCQRVRMMEVRVQEIARQIEDHGNRLFGPLPRQGTEDDERKDPDCEIDMLFFSLDRLDAAINRIASAYNRISGV